MPKKALLNIEVVFATSTQSRVIPLQVSSGTTILEAIQCSGLLTLFPEIDLMTTNKVGIFGQLTTLEKVVVDNDRVEIYRPLPIDPRTARAARVKQIRLKRPRKTKDRL